MKVLRRAAREVATYPGVVFVHQGTVEEGEDFFATFWPDARAIADPEREFYALFGLAEGTFGQLLGLRVIGAAVKSMIKGNGVGKAVGDVKTMPGAFLFEGGEIVWRHDYRHAGDHPDFLALR